MVVGIGPLSQRVYDSLAPLTTRDQQNNYALAQFIGAIGDALFQEIEDYASDTPAGEPGWSVLLSPDTCPAKALPWLGQLVGVTVNQSLSEADQRTQIKNVGGWNRGSVSSIVAAVQQYLTGNKTVLLKERDTSAWHFNLVTFESETRRSGINNGTPLTVSGNEVTDVTRAAAAQGDGLQYPASAFGIYRQTTNILPAGSESAWSGFNGTDGFNNVNVSSPYGRGFKRVPKLGPSGATNTQIVVNNTMDMTGLAGNVYTVSFIFRTDGTLDFNMNAFANPGGVNSFASLTKFVITLGNGDMFVYARYQIAAGTTFLRMPDFSPIWGTSTYVDVKWAQVEYNQYPTAYIPATTTRPASQVYLPTSVVPFTAAQGWVAMRGAQRRDVGATLLNSQRVFIQRWGVGDQYIFAIRQANQLYAQRQNLAGGSACVSGQNLVPGQHETYIIAWTPTQLKTSLNNSIFSVVPDTHIPTLTPSFTYIGCDGPAENYDGDIFWFAAGKGPLTQDDVALLNSFGDRDPRLEELNPASLPKIVVPFNDSSFQIPSTQPPEIIAAINATKPAGLQYTYAITSGIDYAAEFAGYTTYQAERTAFATYQGMYTNTPGA